MTITLSQDQLVNETNRFRAKLGSPTNKDNKIALRLALPIR